MCPLKLHAFLDDIMSQSELTTVPWYANESGIQIVTIFDVISQLTFILVVGSDGENGVLDVLVFVDFGLVKMFVKVRRVVVLVRN